MEVPMDINNFLTLITTQNHDNNQFNTEGEHVTALATFREMHGYPSEDETRAFIAVSDRTTPILIIQKHDQPVGNRPADIVEVYEISSDIVNNPSVVILRQFTSDTIFGTNSVKLNTDPNILLQTWVKFISIAKHNQKISFANCIYKIGSNATENIHKVCRTLTEEEITRAFYIMNSLSNTTNGKIKALKIACLNFDETVEFSSSELLSALETIPECEFKTKGFWYLAKNDKVPAVTDYIMNDPQIQQEMLNDYILAIQQCNIDAAKRCRINLNPYYLLKQATTTREKQLSNVVPSSLDISFELMIEVLIICLVFYHNDVCSDFISKVKKTLRDNQSYRHSLMIYIYSTKYQNDMLHFFLEERRISSLLSIFSSNYSNDYIHDAYFLGLITHSKYKRASNDFETNCNALAELAITSYDNNDGYLDFFTNSATRKIKKCVSSSLKDNAVSSVNNEIRNCFKELLALYKKKTSIVRNMRHIIKK